MTSIGIGTAIGKSQALSGGGGGESRLLDAVGNAAAAYSVRKLRAAYSGSALRVRRSSDDAEQDIGFDGSGDLDTSALTAFVGANNGYVVTMYDQSGNGANATQPTTSSQRQIVTSGTLNTVTNGKPGLRLTNTFFTATVSLTQAHTVMFAGIPQAGTHGMMDYSGTGGRTLLRLSGGVFALFAGNNLSSAVFTATDAVFLGLCNSASSKLRRNGTEIASGNAGTNGLGSLTVFGQHPGGGPAYGCELVLWDSDVSADFATIESNVADYYGITLP